MPFAVEMSWRIAQLINVVTMNYFKIPLLTGLILVSGCSQESDEIKVYRVSKPSGHEAPAAAQIAAPAAPAPAAAPSINPSTGMQVLPGMAEAAAAVATPDWQVPEEWTVLAPTAIRKGNFTAGTSASPVEITVTSFPGDVGGLAANINRWRQQAGMGELPPAEALRHASEIEVSGIPAHLIDIPSGGAPHPTILGAAIPHGGHTWFVKLVGENQAAYAQKDNLIAFLESIRFASY